MTITLITTRPLSTLLKKLMIDLNEKQREDVTRQYVQIVVDDWDTKELVRYAISQLTAYFNEGSIEELKADVDDRDEDLFDELVDNATQQYPKQPQTFIDINNTGGKY